MYTFNKLIKTAPSNYNSWIAGRNKHISYYATTVDNHHSVSDHPTEAKKKKTAGTK